MMTKTLGTSGLRVTRLCLGTMTFGNQADEPTAHAILDKAFDSGVRFLDTSDMYPLGYTWEQVGSTEEIIGRWLPGKRDEVVLATKCAGPVGVGMNDRGLGRKHILDAIDKSLLRLKTDYVDLYQAHFFDAETPLEETLRAFEDVVRAGKVRYIGVSNWRAWQVAKARGIAHEKDYLPIQSVQPRYNLLFRMIEEDLVPLCLSEGMGLMTYNPLAGGMLTGRYRPGQGVEAGSRFDLGGVGNSGKMYQGRYWNDAVFEVVEQYRDWCNERDRDMATTAVQWASQQPGVTSVIIGASQPNQLDASLQAMTAPALQEEELAWLDHLWFDLPRRREDR